MPERKIRIITPRYYRELDTIVHLINKAGVYASILPNTGTFNTGFHKIESDGVRPIFIIEGSDNLDITNFNPEVYKIHQGLNDEDAYKMLYYYLVMLRNRYPELKSNPKEEN